MAYVIVLLILAPCAGLVFGEAVLMLGQAIVDLARAVARRRSRR